MLAIDRYGNNIMPQETNEPIGERNGTMSELTMKYFVLKPKGSDEYAKASREAMLKYASIIQWSNPHMATELRDWVKKEKSDACKPTEEEPKDE